MPKVGKTTLACKFPKCLLIAPERGYSTIPGVTAAPIDNWSDFVSILNQLEKNKKEVDLLKLKGDKEADTTFHTIIIDIVDILYDYVEKFILNREGAEKVADIPYGGGYSLIKKEFDTKLRKIVQMGYGLILISHAAIKVDEDTKITNAAPTLAKTPKLICTRLVDVYAYVSEEINEGGEKVRVIHLRGTPEFEAGSRFKYITDTIPLSYKALKGAIGDAIKQLEEEDGEEYVTDTFKNNYEVKETPEFEQTISDINSIIGELLEKASVNGEQAVLIERERIALLIEDVLGKGRKLSLMTEDQIELAVVIKDKLETLKG